MTEKYKLNRRELMAWTTPVVSAVLLPAHAQTSNPPPPPELESCNGPPVLSVVEPPKCSGNPPVGTAVIEVSAFDSTSTTLKGISSSTNDPKSDIMNLPMFPTSVTDVDAESFTWMGPASDGESCLPLASITVTIEYCCEDGVSLSEDYDLTQLIVNSAP